MISSGSLSDPVDHLPEGRLLSQEMLHRIYRHIEERRPN
jgi:hypothetical protein